MRFLKLAALALLALPSLAQGKTLKVGPGIQMTPRTSAPSKDNVNAAIYYNSTSGSIVVIKPNGTELSSPSIAATTKGDLVVFTGTTWMRLGVGTNGQCLVADSAQTGGIKWASCGGGGGGSMSLTCGTGLSCSPSTITDTGSVSLANTAVTPGSGYSTFTVDAQGRITAAGFLSYTLSAIASTSPSDMAMTLLAAGGGFVIADGSPSLAGDPLLFVTDNTQSNTYLLVADTGTDIGQKAVNAANRQLLTITGGAHTALPTTANVPDIVFALNRTVQHATGTVAAQDAIVINPPTYSFVGSSTITKAATLTIHGGPGAGANASITDSFAIKLDTGGRILVDQTGVSSNSGVLVRNGGLTIDDPDEQASQLLTIKDSSGNDVVMVSASGNAATTYLQRFPVEISTGSHLTVRDDSTPIGSPLLLVEQNDGTDILSVTPALTTFTEAVAATHNAAVLLATSATATSGNQKWSPAITLQGSGYKTGGTPGAQLVAYSLKSVPVQGTSSALGALRLSESIAGGAEDTLFQFGSAENTTSRDLVPSSTATYKLGSSSLKYSELHTTPIDATSTTVAFGSSVAAIDLSNTRMTIGNPASPAGRLHVAGSTGSNAYIRVDNTTGSIFGGLGGADSNNTVWVGSLSNHPVAIRVNNTDVITIGSSTITPTVPIAGSGYLGSSDQVALGAASTSSTTYVDVGNGSSTGFASWTSPSIPVTKTYVVRVNVRFYMSTVGSTATTYFQLLKDGSTIGTHPTNVNRAPIGVAGTTYANCTFEVPVALTSGTTPVFKLQWKVGDGSATANVTASVGTLQLVLVG